MVLSPYPGTAHHQALLEQIVHHYEDDPRVLAVCLFGSLVRGNWDQYSDLDLDVVLGDGVQIDVLTELANLCGAFEPLGEYPLIIVPDGDEAGDVVLSSLAEFSIRYHPLATTSPNIADNLHLLAGTLDLDTIQTAGRANLQPGRVVGGDDVDRFLRAALEVTLRLKRRQFFQAERLLQFMRQTWVELYAYSRGYPRAYLAFEDHADETLKAALGATFPAYGPESIRAALLRMLDLLENHLAEISDGRLYLTDAQREILAQIRAN